MFDQFGWDYPPGVSDATPDAPWNAPECDPDGCDTGWDYGPDRSDEE